MCGIAGFLGFGDLQVADVNLIASRMGNAIRHRGPDDSGIWCDEAAQLTLVHRRLSILDLSPAGHQPMVSASGRFVLVFNGEIYNHQDLRNNLDKIHGQDTAGLEWRGHSDTETLLVAIETWGLEATLKRCTGMFAIALWDRKERQLSLARDRIGEKPLYYGWQRGVFLFGSELKAIRAHPAFLGEINRDAIALQMRHNYIPTPYSIYSGIHKLSPGTILSVDWSALNTERCDVSVSPKPYWSFTDVVNQSTADIFSGTDDEAITQLDGLLSNAVSRQMIADVPLGAFLSGGVDSSLIVALMQSQSQRPVKTFTIGFNESGYNEADYARAVARYLGTDHTELYVSSEHAMDVIPRLPTLYDEPFSDSSQVPTFLVSALTRQHVTVSLSGDAGDELFGGYNRYLFTNKLWGNISRLPQPLRKWASGSIHAMSPDTWNTLLKPLQPFLPTLLRASSIGYKLYKGANVLGCRNADELYMKLCSHWDEENLLIGFNQLPSLIRDKNLIFPYLDQFQRMMALDSLSYLPDDILVKVDRAAMAVSLETRVPMLDQRIIEFAFRLPKSMKLRNGETKWLLRQVLYKYVPRELIERPKMGFGVPIDSWLRGPLRDWAEDLLNENRLIQEGYFNPAPIRQKWAEHQSGTRNWQYHLWDVLMFQAWLKNEINSTGYRGV